MCFLLISFSLDCQHLFRMCVLVRVYARTESSVSSFHHRALSTYMFNFGQQKKGTKRMSTCIHSLCVCMYQAVK